VTKRGGGVEKLRQAGLKFTSDAKPGGNLLNGNSFVLTGTLTRFSREEVSDLIRKNGGTVSSAVSSKTTYLLAGEKPGSKLKKAKKLGITILAESEFLKMLNL